MALVRGVAGAQTTAGPAAAGVFCAVVLVVLMAGLISLLRRPARLEVGADEIRFVRRDGQVSALPRQSGHELRFVKQRRGAFSRVWTLGVGVVGTDTVIDLPGFFARNAVRQACAARDWQLHQLGVIRTLTRTRRSSRFRCRRPGPSRGPAG